MEVLYRGRTIMRLVCHCRQHGVAGFIFRIYREDSI